MESDTNTWWAIFGWWFLLALFVAVPAGCAALVFLLMRIVGEFQALGRRYVIAAQIALAGSLLVIAIGFALLAAARYYEGS